MEEVQGLVDLILKSDPSAQETRKASRWAPQVAWEVGGVGQDLVGAGRSVLGTACVKAGLD